MTDKTRSVCLRCGDAIWREDDGPWQSFRGGAHCPPTRDPHTPHSDPK